MLARTLLVGVSFAAILSSVFLPSSASAQFVNARRMETDPFPGPIVQALGGQSSGFASSQTPSLSELATRSIDRYQSRVASCESHRLQNQQWARRESDAARKKLARATPVKQWTDEELAASKFQAARGLWQAGNTPAARRWLEVVLRDYSATPTAQRARLVLAKL